jgi:hypothetical protein
MVASKPTEEQSELEAEKGRGGKFRCPALARLIWDAD